jgi:hypothetical protein
MPGPYYVDSNATGGGNTGADWTNAFTAFASAISAASTAGDFIYVAHNHSESLAADTTYTALADIRVICRNSGTDALATGAVIGAQATVYAITFSGAFDVYFYGLHFKNGATVGGSSKSLTFSADGMHYEFESCQWTLNAGAGSTLTLGPTGSGANSYVKTLSCSVTFTATAQSIFCHNRQDHVGFAIAGTAPTRLIVQAQQARINFEGCDLSAATGIIVGNQGTNGHSDITFVNCKMGSGFSFMEAPATILNKGQTTVWAFNCASGDTHYAMFHGDAFGTTTVSDTIYADDGAQYDGTNRCSWVITTRENNCSYFTPYVSPVDRPLPQRHERDQPEPGMPARQQQRRGVQ